MDATQILPTIFENLGKALPFRIIHEYQSGIRWTRGQASDPLEPGVRFFLYLVQSIDVFDMTEGKFHLGTQAIGTENAGLLNVTSSLNYRITNPKSLAINLGYSDLEATIRSRSRGLVSSAVLSYDRGNGAEHFSKGKEAIEDSVLNKMRELFHERDYGLEAISFQIEELGPTQSFSLHGFGDNETLQDSLMTL